MERYNVPLSINLKHEFEETIIFEKLQPPPASILQIGSTPDVALAIAKAGYDLTVCSDDVEYLNTLSTQALRQNLSIKFKDYSRTLSNINEQFDTVICVPDYEYETRNWWPTLDVLLQRSKDSGELIWSYNSIDLTRNNLEAIGYKTLDSWVYNTLSFIDVDMDEEDSVYKSLTAFFEAEEVHHFWSYIQMIKFNATVDEPHSILCLLRKDPNEESCNTSEGELEATTEQESPEDGGMENVSVCS